MVGFPGGSTPLEGSHKSSFDSNLTQSFPHPLHPFAMSVTDHNQSNKISTDSDVEAEKADFAGSHNGPSHQSLQRQLKNRHIAMIR